MASKDNQNRKPTIQFEKEPCKKCPYKKTGDIDPLIFNDRFFTVPAIKSTYLFMEHLLKHHPDDLFFLYEKAQEYVDIEGSQYRMDFPKWIKRAEKNLHEYEEK